MVYDLAYRNPNSFKLSDFIEDKTGGMTNRDLLLDNVFTPTFLRYLIVSDSIERTIFLHNTCKETAGLSSPCFIAVTLMIISTFLPA